MSQKKVAFIGTGGTIASIGVGPLDTVNYGATGRMMQADAILDRFPEVQQVAEVVAVPYRNVPSTADRLGGVAAAGPALRPGGGRGSGHRRHRHRPWHRLAGGDRLFPLADAEGGGAGGAGRRAAAGLGAVHRCRAEPGECGARRGQPGGARPRRAGAAERRDPGGARGNQDLDRPAADLPQPGFRGARPGRWRPGRSGTAGRCAGWRRIPNSTSAAWRRCRGSTSPTAYAGADGTAVRAFTAAGAQGHRRRRLRPGLRHPGRCRGAGGSPRRRGGGGAVDPRRQRPGLPDHQAGARPASSRPTT